MTRPETKDGDMSQAILDEPSKMPWRSSVQFVEESMQQIEWLISGVLPCGAIVLLSGREGTMKSFLALSMAHAVATGTPWLGRPTKQGGVLYLDGEMPPALLRDRIRGIGPAHSLNIWSWADGTFPYQLGNSGLGRASQEHSLIVVDTLRRHMEGKKENSSDDMAAVTKALRELTLYGATVLVLHHAPKDTEKQGYRGSTELGAGVDTTLVLTKKPTTAGAVLTLGEDKTRTSSSVRLEIEAKTGPRVPVFTLRDKQKPAKGGLSELALLVNELREHPGRNPNQTEIIKKAKDEGLGGKDKIRGMLKDGEGRYWRAESNGKEISYASLT